MLKGLLQEQDGHIPLAGRANELASLPRIRPRQAPVELRELLLLFHSVERFRRSFFEGWAAVWRPLDQHVSRR